MNQSNIITPPQFAEKMDAGRLAELKDQGLTVKNAPVLDTLDLADPKYGEQILGELTPEEAELYASYYAVNEELDDLNRQCGSALMIKSGEAVRDRKEKEFDVSQAVPEEIAIKFFQKLRQADMLKNLFYWYIGERFNAHDFTLGVRSKGRVVKGPRKW